MRYIKNSLFDGVDEVEYKDLVGSIDAEEVKFKKGAVIYSFGANSDRMGVVLDGTAKIVRHDEDGNDVLLEKPKKSAVFGDNLAFFGMGSEFVVAVAETDCSVLFFSYRKTVSGCGGMCDQRHRFLINLFAAVCAKTSQLSERIAVISNRTIKEKLIAYFNFCSAKYKSKTFKLDMSLCALSEYLCADRSAMMREIKKLKEERVIDLFDKKVTILV